jgi:hypothetical protein
MSKSYVDTQFLQGEPGKPSENDLTPGNNLRPDTPVVSEATVEKTPAKKATKKKGK